MPDQRVLLPGHQGFPDVAEHRPGEIAVDGSERHQVVFGPGEGHVQQPSLFRHFAVRNIFEELRVRQKGHEGCRQVGLGIEAAPGRSLRQNGRENAQKDVAALGFPERMHAAELLLEGLLLARVQTVQFVQNDHRPLQSLGGMDGEHFHGVGPVHGVAFGLVGRNVGDVPRQGGCGVHALALLRILAGEIDHESDIARPSLGQAPSRDVPIQVQLQRQRFHDLRNGLVG